MVPRGPAAGAGDAQRHAAERAGARGEGPAVGGGDRGDRPRRDAARGASERLGRGSRGGGGSGGGRGGGGGRRGGCSCGRAAASPAAAGAPPASAAPASWICRCCCRAEPCGPGAAAAAIRESTGPFFVFVFFWFFDDENDETERENERGRETTRFPSNHHSDYLLFNTALYRLFPSTKSYNRRRLGCKALFPKKRGCGPVFFSRSRERTLTPPPLPLRSFQPTHLSSSILPYLDICLSPPSIH